MLLAEWTRVEEMVSGSAGDEPIILSREFRGVFTYSCFFISKLEQARLLRRGNDEMAVITAVWPMENSHVA